MANIFTNLVPPAGNGVGAAVDVSALGPLKTITVQGVFTGVVTVEYSEDGGVTFAQLASFAAGGKQTITLAARFMRVRRGGVGLIPGTPNIDVASDDTGQLFANLPVPAGNGTGASVDVSALGTLNTVVVGGTFTGNVVVEISEDNVVWTQCLFYAQGGGQTKKFVAQFMRVRRQNVGAVPGTPTVDVGAANDPASSLGDNTLDQAYDQGGPGAGRTIIADAGAVVVQTTAADDNNVVEIIKNPAGAQSGDGLNVTMGAAATGAGLEIAHSGSGLAINVASGNVDFAGTLQVGTGSLPAGSALVIEAVGGFGEILGDRGGFFAGLDAEATIGAIAHVLSGYDASVAVASGNTQNWTAAVGLRGYTAQISSAPGSGGTVTGGAVYYAADASIGGAVVLTRNMGMFVEPMTAGTTDNIGIWIEEPTGGATLNDAIHVVGGRSFLGGRLFVGSTTPFLPFVGTILASETFTNAATDTTAIAGLSEFVVTGAPTANNFSSIQAAGTIGAASDQNLTDVIGLSGCSAIIITAPGSSGVITGAACFRAQGALVIGATITRMMGVLIENQSAGVTDNIGIWIEAPTGGATLNDAIHVVGGRTFLGGAVTFTMGTGAGLAQASGTANVNTTAVGTDADLLEKTLITYDLPANSLSANGKLVKIRVWGTTAANANTKTIRLYFGTAVVRQIGASATNDEDWIMEAIVVRTGAATQDAIGFELVNNSTVFTTHSEPAEDETAAITIRVTGENAVATANDIVAEGMLVEYLN